MTERLPDWVDRLADFITETRDVPFVWGQQDCALWAAAAAAAQTGEDRAADFRGQYDTHAGALQALRDIGSGTLLKTYQARYPEKPKANAMRGDLIWNGFAIGVCMGGYALFLGEPDGEPGLVRVQRADWKRAFAVGAD